MALKFGTTLRNAILEQIETTVGASAKLQIRTGAPPTNPSDADSGTLLVEITVPADWASNAAAGSKALQGVWSGTAVATGAPGHFRLKDNAGTTTHLQGTATVNGGGGDVDVTIPGAGTDITSGGTVTVTTFTFNAPNG